MWCSVPERFQLNLAMLLTQFGFAGFHVITRAALNMGISKYVFPVYRNIIALILLLPLAYFFEKKQRPAISLSLLGQFFLVALVGVTANQSLYLFGLENTSPTFVSAIQNSVPAITFLMAIILRIEQVKLNRKDGLAKVAGTIFCVAGATVITLYKGPTIYNPNPPLHNSIITKLQVLFDFGSDSVLDKVEEKNWVLGCIYLIGHCLCWACWLVFQTPLLKKYPARLSLSSYTFFFGLLQFLLIALIFERDPKTWVFHSAKEAVAILYGGVVISGVAFTVQLWCIDRGGPVFVAMFQPVQTFVVALFGSLALGEEFYLGGIIGAVLIVAGMYLVLWGKSEEKKFAIMEQLAIAERTIIRPASHVKPSLTQPFLQSSSQNV